MQREKNGIEMVVEWFIWILVISISQFQLCPYLSSFVNYSICLQFVQIIVFNYYSSINYSRDVTIQGWYKRGHKQIWWSY
jgi:hypothetical protein